MRNCKSRVNKLLRKNPFYDSTGNIFLSAEVIALLLFAFWPASVRCSNPRSVFTYLLGPQCTLTQHAFPAATHAMKFHAVAIFRGAELCLQHPHRHATKVSAHSSMTTLRCGRGIRPCLDRPRWLTRISWFPVLMAQDIG